MCHAQLLFRAPPQCFIFLEAEILERSLCHLLDKTIASLETPSSADEGRFGIDIVMARQVDDREKKVADFSLALGRSLGGVDLGELLVDLLARPAGVGPIEALASGSVLDLLGAAKCRQSQGDSVED